MLASRFALGKRFLVHWLNAVDQHSLQSPFIYEFYTKVVKNEVFNPSYQAVRDLRRQLRKDMRALDITDFGAGSMVNGKKTVSTIAKTSHQPAVSQLLYSITEHFQPNMILELGTSLGLSSLGMAVAKTDAHIITIEASRQISKMARINFRNLGVENIELVEGNIDRVLDMVLEKIQKIDLLFMDANHRFETTLDYFFKCRPKFHQDTIVVIDDIHWSGSMEQAWKEICQRPGVTQTADLFYSGVVFFKPELIKEDFVLSL